MLLRMAAAVDRLRGSVDLQERRQCSVVVSAKDGCCSRLHACQSTCKREGSVALLRLPKMVVAADCLRGSLDLQEVLWW